MLEDVLELQKTGHAGALRVRKRTAVALDEVVVSLARISTSRESQRGYAQAVRAPARLAQLTRQYSGQAPALRAPARVFVEQRSDWTVKINVAGLQRILLNLCSNASKHTLSSGTVDVHVRLEPAAKGAHAIIEVRDSGEGMTQDFVENSLFQPFVQASSFSSGAGLGPSLVGLSLTSAGMSIVKGIVAEMGGQISVTSERNVGTSASVVSRRSADVPQLCA